MRFWLSFVIFVCWSVPATASPMTVLTTVKPIGLIIEAISDGTANHQILLPAGGSPHDYALKPSDVLKIKNADVIFWAGPELESFLTTMLQDNPKAVALMEEKNTSWRVFEVEEEDGDHSHHHTHNHQHDPHFWLGIPQVTSLVPYIVSVLSEKDPVNATQYSQNAALFLIELKKNHSEIQTQLQSVAQQGYFVFHDGYGYFEDTFRLLHLGHFTVSPDRRPGAKTLYDIRQKLKQQKAQCVFIEPQFSPNIVESIVEGTSVKIGVLDPMASDAPLDKHGYFVFLKNMTSSFYNCLSPTR